MLVRKLLKEIALWSIPFFILLSFLFFTKVIKKDFIYAHYLFGTGKPPYNWINDYTSYLKKILHFIKNDNKSYLPKVSLFMSPREIILSDVPNTVKEWQRGKLFIT